MHWFTKSWWKYLLAPRADEISFIRAFICRIKGHPCGVIYYNICGSEPDMTCINCGDDLG